MSDVTQELPSGSTRRPARGTIEEATVVAGRQLDPEPLFRTISSDVPSFSGPAYGACPRCTTERHVVAEPHATGTLRLGLVCDGCDTRIMI